MIILYNQHSTVVKSMDTKIQYCLYDLLADGFNQDPYLSENRFLFCKMGIIVIAK